MLFFAALMLTLGVKAQEGSTVAERGAAKGYYPFAAEVTKMEQITSLAQLTDGMEIMIKHSHEGTNQDDHEGSYLTIYSLPTYGAAHIVFMQEKPVEVGVWTTETVSAEDGILKLLSAHGVITNSTCYLGQLGWNYTAQNYLSTTGNINYIGEYKFVPATDGSGRWNIQCTNNKDKTYLSVTADSKGNPTIGEAYSIDKNCYFEIYGVKEKSTEQVKYVENAQVKLIGPSGNIVTTTHTGWSDFYEFVMYSGSAQNSVNYGVSISNVLYHESENLITASIKYAFPISGDVAKIPVHLCPMGNENFRISIVDGNLKVVEKPADGWVKDKNNQWYIFPRYDNQDFTYAIKNVGTGQYINFTEGSRDITLSENSTYFTLGANTAGTYLNFEFKYSSLYTYCLYGSNVDYVNSYNASNSIPAYKVHTFDKSTTNSGKNFLVSPVSSTELDGVPAIGFTRYFHEDAYFWDGGEIADENVPDAVKANRASSSHEEYNAGVHKVFSAETGITVTQTGNVTAQFDFISGMNALQILGVDIVKRDDARTVVSFDYHLGKAGTPSQNNLYVLENVEAEDYYIRYWVCNRTDLDGWEGHNLKNVRGKIEVKGANYAFTPTDALEDGAFPANTTWYRMRLQDGLGKYISAHPDYMDEDNYLKLSNNTPPSDYAGLWAIVGNETDGYKFYNRAWGPEYAMKTTGENGDARTFMAPANEATSYDIVRDLDAEDISARYKYYVKVHGTDHNYLNDHANNGYLRTWNTADAGTNASGSGSVMTFETVNMDGWDERTEACKENLSPNWLPWLGVPEVSTIYNNFAQLMLNRGKLGTLLNGKAFKFVTRATDERANRVLGVNANSQMVGLMPSNQDGGDINEYVQLICNTDGTYHLLHLGTNKYFGVPEDEVLAGDLNSAAKYGIVDYESIPGVAVFVVGDTHMMNLGESSRGYKLTNWLGHPEDLASQWTVTYVEDENLQSCLGAIEEAKARYAEVMADAYQANVGVPGYANAETTNGLNDAINGLSGKTFEKVITALNGAMAAVDAAEKAVIYPTDCYFTITNRGNSLVYNADKTERDDAYNSEFIWTTNQVDKTNVNHLWGFYLDAETGDYYLYNVGKRQFVNSKGKGGFSGNTWIFSDFPVTITMEAMDAPFFHIKGDDKTMSVSTGYVGPVITYYADGDGGVPMQFNKSTVTVDQDLLNELKNKEVLDLASGFYTFKYNDLYMNDTRLGGAGTEGDGRRTLTTMDENNNTANIFYYNSEKELVGYASGYGFTYGYCNTGKPEEGYNAFEFKRSHEPGKYIIDSNNGNSVLGWGDRYLRVSDNQFTDADAWNKKLAAAWTIEEVTSIPVTLNYAKGKGAYATLWSPVALNLPDGVRAYTGYVEDKTLTLDRLQGTVIPANAGVVLWAPDAAENTTYKFGVNKESTVENPANNTLEGSPVTILRGERGCYSLGMKNNVVAFYNYVGEKLTGFRARIFKDNDALQGVQVLSFRFRDVTGVEEVVAAFENDAIYDLSGRRVTTPTKGLYIVNGKKVFIK